MDWKNRARFLGAIFALRDEVFHIVYHDGCADGYTSAAMLVRFLDGIGAKSIPVAHTHGKVTCIKDPDVLILLDVQATALGKWVTAKVAPMHTIVIDHHEHGWPSPVDWPWSLDCFHHSGASATEQLAFLLGITMGDGEASVARADVARGDTFDNLVHLLVGASGYQDGGVADSYFRAMRKGRVPIQSMLEAGAGKITALHDEYLGTNSFLAENNLSHRVALLFASDILGLEDFIVLSPSGDGSFRVSARGEDGVKAARDRGIKVSGHPKAAGGSVRLEKLPKTVGKPWETSSVLRELFDKAMKEREIEPIR